MTEFAIRVEHGTVQLLRGNSRSLLLSQVACEFPALGIAIQTGLGLLIKSEGRERLPQCFAVCETALVLHENMF
jgi:hypothetical protein